MRTKNTQSTLNKMPGDLLIARHLLYDKCGLELTDFKSAIESVEYAACTFRLNGMAIQHRSSKITPTKTGQFVTIWKRNQQEITEPFNIEDVVDFVIITARSEANLGQFIFPKSVLFEKGIISGINHKGKLGIRVYPPWDKATNQQAEKTQIWQTKYFWQIKK
jgi:hypothetical protein